MMTQLQKLLSLVGLYSTMPLSNRNYIVDGNFDQWTATSGTVGVSTYVAATMYRTYTGAGGAANVSQNLWTLGTDLIPWTSPTTSGLNFQQTVASTGTPPNNSPAIQHYIEDVRTLNGRSSTFSLWLLCTSGTVNITNILASQYFGTGGSPSPTVQINTPVNWTVTGTFKRFSVRVDWPSINGKTEGTNKDSHLQIGIWLPGGQTFGVVTAQWQLEQSSPQSSSDIAGSGGAPTAFEYRGQQAELARVQRYYEASTTSIVWSGNVTSGSNYYSGTQFKVTKRAIPTMTYAASGGFLNFPNSAPAASGAQTDGCAAVAVAAGTGAGVFGFTYIADARL